MKGSTKMAIGNIIIKKATWTEKCIFSCKTLRYTGYKIWDNGADDVKYIGRLHKASDTQTPVEWHAEPPKGTGEYEIGFHNRKAAIGYLLVTANESH